MAYITRIPVRKVGNDGDGEMTVVMVVDIKHS